MNISLIYFTQAGGEICLKIKKALNADGDCCICSEGRGLAGGLSQWTKEAFVTAEALIFVSATGIAVRAVAPYLKSKTSDPAVVVIDEKGLHVISLLSGHMGGANQLTKRIAAFIGAEPVITTATDINGRFAVDEWAKKQRLFISDMKEAKEVSAALLRGEPVGFCSEFPITGQLPPGLVPWTKPQENTEGGIDGVEVALAVVVSLRRPVGLPFQRILWLVPRILTVGIGCRRDTPEERIRETVEAVLNENGMCIGAVKKIASIDIKRDEAGLIAYAEHLRVPFEVFSAEELAMEELAAEDFPEGFAASDFVKSVTGVDNVCERAAAAGSKDGEQGKDGDRSRFQLLVRKTARQGVTVAVATDTTKFHLIF